MPLFVVWYTTFLFANHILIRACASVFSSGELQRTSLHVAVWCHFLSLISSKMVPPWTSWGSEFAAFCKIQTWISQSICGVQIKSRCPEKGDIELYNISFLILKVELHLKWTRWPVANLVHIYLTRWIEGSGVWHLRSIGGLDGAIYLPLLVLHHTAWSSRKGL